MKELIVIVGPTAVGKTKLSIELAKHYNAEIISGDALQIYRGMNIGTGKIMEEEMQDIPHYMLDIKEPNETFSVANFKESVQHHIDTIHQKGMLPILVGGSGFYIQAVLYDYEFTDRERNEEITKELETFANEHGNDALYKKLQQVDPDQAEKIHPNNVRRVVRAIEIYKTMGKTMSELHDNEQKQPKYDHILLGLEMERENLYNRINKRVDEMIAHGLLDEVKDLYDQGYEHTQALQAIGYKELIPYVKEETDLATATDLLKRNTRRFAKRQYTWFYNKMDVTWFDASKADIRTQLITYIDNVLSD